MRDFKHLLFLALALNSQSQEQNMCQGFTMDPVGLDIGWRTLGGKREKGLVFPLFIDHSDYSRVLQGQYWFPSILIIQSPIHAVGWPGSTLLKTLKTGGIFRFQVDSLHSSTSQGHRAPQKQVYLYIFCLLQKCSYRLNILTKIPD